MAVRSLFPGTLGGAVRQKGRWIAGIALAGWDRTGWAGPLALGDHWMRLRDRRAPLAMLVLAAAYGAIVAWAVAATLHWAGDTAPPPVGAGMRALLAINSALLAWRLVARMAFTGRLYGVGEALWSVPRFVVGNLVTLLASPRALLLYARLLAGRAPVWDKTAHDFPLAIES